ncbi:MAG: site-specific DNA-methyltransferase [Desulfuromonadales bacterium]|nr:site-specific DNA-methyltransferase [Desulfuromonadales bacterium]
MTTDKEIRLPLTSPDLTEELLAQLRESVPQVFSEGKVDFSKLKMALGENVDSGIERYGLNWAGKSEAFRNVQSSSVGTLLPMIEESVDWNTTENQIIEGDNLEVLKLLQKPYHGKVKMIYIDPPYNTGNEFIYPDNYREGLHDYLRYSGQVNDEGVKQSTNTETSGRYHSNWLSMMYPRLFLARNLLREDGVIFVSIDDHEVHNLRLLMDEVFGEENFIDPIIWKKRYGGGAKEKYLVALHEYILVYSKNKEKLENFYIPLEEDSIKRYYKSKDEHFPLRGPYRTHPLEAMKSFDVRENLSFPILSPNGEEVWPKRQWRWGQERVKVALKNNEIEFSQDKNNNWILSSKQYLKDEEGEVRKTKPFSIVDNVFTQHGTNEMVDIFGDAKMFSFPKPSKLLVKLITVGLNYSRDDLVLDFFAGSASTAHAVMRLNAEDGGNRKFILVQLPEKTDNSEYPTIAHITRERVRRVISKLNAEDEGKLDLPKKQDRGFRAFRLATSNFKIWDASQAPSDPEALAEQLKLYADNIERLRDNEAILFELLLKSGLPLSSCIECLDIEGLTVFAVNKGQLLICLEKPVSHATLRGMIAKKPRQVLCLDTAFGGDDKLKTNILLEAQSHQVVFRTV